MKVCFLNEAPLIKLCLAEGFKQAGHEVYIIMGEENRLWSKPREEQLRRINRALDEANPDLVFVEGYAGIDIQAVLPEIKKRKIPIFYWAIEDPVSTHLSDAHIPYADLIFTTTIERVPFYEKHGVPSELLLFACNPDIHKNVGVFEEYKHDIVLVAANYSNRYDKAAWFVIPLIEAGYDIKIWGIWWDDANRPVNLCKYPEIYGGILPYEELAKVYSSAKIVLGMNADDSSITQTSMRPFEVAGCGGGIYLGHYTKAVENVFDAKLAQVMGANGTKSIVDIILKEKINVKSYVEDAQNFVYENHTYRHRAEQIAITFNKMFR